MWAKAIIGLRLLYQLSQQQLKRVVGCWFVVVCFNGCWFVVVCFNGCLLFQWLLVVVCWFVVVSINVCLLLFPFCQNACTRCICKCVRRQGTSRIQRFEATNRHKQTTNMINNKQQT